MGENCWVHSELYRAFVLNSKGTWPLRPANSNFIGVSPTKPRKSKQTASWKLIWKLHMLLLHAFEINKQGTVCWTQFRSVAGATHHCDLTMQQSFPSDLTHSASNIRGCRTRARTFICGAGGRLKICTRLEIKCLGRDCTQMNQTKLSAPRSAYELWSVGGAHKIHR